MRTATLLAGLILLTSIVFTGCENNNQEVETVIFEMPG